MDDTDGLEEKASILDAAMGRPELAAALRRMAPPAREKALLEILGRSSLPVPVRAFAAHGLGHSGAPSAAALEALTWALGDEEGEVAKAATTTLWEILPLAPAGVPRVIGALRNGSPAARRNAAHVLAHLHWGPEPPGEAKQVAPALVAALDDPDASVRRAAAEALCRDPCLNRAEAARPALVRLAGEPDSSVRIEALRALQWSGDRGPDAIHALAAGLEDADPVARIEAALAFACRSSSFEADPPLRAIFIAGLSDTNPRVRERALEALAQANWGDESSLVPTLIDLLKDPDGRVRHTAGCQIMNIGMHDPIGARPAIPALIEALAQGVSHAPFTAARALARIEPGEPVLRPFLMEALRHEHLKLRAAALLLEIGVEVEAALGVLLEALRRRWSPRTFRGAIYSHTWRNDAAQAILEHAPAREGVAAGLREFLADPDPVIRAQIALAIARIEPADDAALAAIAAALEDEHHEVRQTALAGLRHVAKHNDRVIPLLMEALRDPSEGVRSSACWVLGELESQPAAAVTLLVECLQASEPMLRRQALDLLHRLGPEAREAEPALVDLLGDPDPGLRLRAAIVLVAIDAGRAARPALEELARDPDERISSPAARTLAALRDGAP